MKLLDRIGKGKTPSEGSGLEQDSSLDEATSSPRMEEPFDSEFRVSEGAEVKPTRRLWFVWFGPRSRFPIYAGLVLIATGFAVTAYTWSKVAGLFQIPLQLPYIASGGPAAIALFVLGATSIWLGAARRDASRREERLDELSEVFRMIAETIQGKKADGGQ